MLTDKEYPATHSMSTAWYMVDAEGNVGILDFEDNGPVPRSVDVEDAMVDELLFREPYKHEVSVHLTADELRLMLGSLNAPTEEYLFCDDIVSIDLAQRAAFLELCENADIESCCISEELGLYWLECYDCFDDDDKLLPDSTLDVMLKHGMILAVAKSPHLDLNVDGDKSDDVIERNKYARMPYYLYGQPYDPNFLARRINVPKIPVHISQVSPSLRDRLLRVPVRFRDMPTLQIARYLPCWLRNADDYKSVGESDYALLPIEDGTRRYLRLTPFTAEQCPHCPFRCAGAPSACLSRCTQMTEADMSELVTLGLAE